MLAPARELVDGARDDFLAGAAFAEQQHRGLGGRHARDLVVDLLHRGRAADQAAEAAHAAQLVAQRADLRAQLAALRHAREHRLQALQVDGLGEVVGGAEAQRLDRALDARVAGDEDGLDRRAVLEVLEEVHAAAVGQPQVHQDHVGALAHELDARFGHAAGRGGGEAFLRRERREGLARVGIVVDDEDMGHG